MIEIMDKLQVFLPVKAIAKKSEFDDGGYEIVDARTNVEIGGYSINENGELIGFSLFEEPSAGKLAKEEIAAIAQKFVDTFYPGQTEYELSGILDLDNPYMITYEKRDQKYGIFIHSTGLTVSVSTSGEITSFYCDEEDYEIRYSDIVVSEKEALEKYIEALDFELNIQKFDRDVYENGDNQYHLAYSVIEHTMEIPVDGSEISSIREGFELDSPIEKIEVPNDSIYELIGITNAYQLLGKQVKEGYRVEIWSMHDEVEEYTFDMDEIDDHVIKLCFDEKSNRLLQVVSGEESANEGVKVELASAKERALEMMFTLFPDTHEMYRLEVFEDENGEFDEEMEDTEEEDFGDEEFTNDICDEDELEDDWSEELIEHEDTYTFYFHLHHNGVRVDGHVSFISVGKYTEKIKHVQLDIPDEALYKKLPTSPVISRTEAKEIYKKHLKMERMFIREYNDDGKSIYTLAYVPDFPTTVGHVRAIDAVTGKAMYVDVGDATFFN